MTDKRKQPKALIFDVDGVLFDTEPLHRKAWAIVLNEEKVTVRDEDLMPWTGVSCRIMAADVKKLYDLKPRSEELIARKARVFESILGRELRPFPGLKEILDQLKREFTLAFATGSTRKDIDHMFGIAGFNGIFAQGTTVDDVTELKPHPETYQKTISRLGFSPAQCAALEDSPTGIRAARGADLFTVAVCSAYTPEVLAQADRIFPGTLDACRWFLGR